MSEQAMAGEQHGDAASVGFVDDLLIPNGTPGLNDGGSSGFCGLFETVFEREEGIRSCLLYTSDAADDP